MRESRVTAVIVSYHSASLAAQAMHSLAAERATTGLPDEVVLVDNDSGDGPALQAAVDGAGFGDWARVIVAPCNGGFGYGNNLGMADALLRGPVRYFLLLNPDTVVRPKAVLRLAEFLDGRCEVGIVGSSLENEDGSDWPIAFRFPTVWAELEGSIRWSLVSRWLRRYVVAVSMDLTRAAPVDWVAGASMMIRSDLAVHLGGFDEAFFLYFEETDLCRRARQQGFSTWYVPDSRVMHIAGQSTKVTQRHAALRRLPSYWFESRRRYFQVNHGTAYSALTDCVVLVGTAIGFAKDLISKRPLDRTPSYARDLVAHSVWLKPRRPLPFKSGLRTRLGRL